MYGCISLLVIAPRLPLHKTPGGNTTLYPLKSDPSFLQSSGTLCDGTPTKPLASFPLPPKSHSHIVAQSITPFLHHRTSLHRCSRLSQYIGYHTQPLLSLPQVVVEVLPIAVTMCDGVAEVHKGFLRL